MMSQIASRKERGFTLIELVMVIVILGILAAFALPRFADFSNEARISSINGLAGAMRSASSIAHARQIASNAASDASVSLENQLITMVEGYPTANAAGIGAAAQISSDYSLSGGGADAEDVAVYFLAPDDGVTTEASQQCRVTYTAAGASTPVSVAVSTGGC